MILLFKEYTIVGADDISRIGNPDYIGILLRADRKMLMLVACDASDLAATRVDNLLDKNAAENVQEFLILNTPADHLALLPELKDHMLELQGYPSIVTGLKNDNIEIHRTENQPNSLLYDMKDAVARSYDEFPLPL